MLILASSKKGQQSVEYYKERWQIETLFSCLKSRGFHLEETHVTDPERIKRLLIIPVITFCWAHRIGEWQHDSVKPIKVKKHLRFSKSIFKTGLDFIRNAIFNPTSLFNLAALFHFLDCPWAASARPKGARPVVQTTGFQPPSLPVGGLARR
ncbi:MAG: transposase [Candidatus Competibacteraceae bacterium]|nr:transposase [Candidatus Competibacteraceae bacterium]